MTASCATGAVGRIPLPRFAAANTPSEHAGSCARSGIFTFPAANRTRRAHGGRRRAAEPGHPAEAAWRPRVRSLAPGSRTGSVRFTHWPETYAAPRRRTPLLSE
ncbi:hypothetical protein ACFH04_17570 [Streptomyces noboritoensis]|uniref:Uncharacterized protein n=1 Tax=Streptomyces noboritoensis TaxID=67337 RepID=A0ABV6TLY4_9ACTN